MRRIQEEDWMLFYWEDCIVVICRRTTIENNDRGDVAVLANHIIGTKRYLGVGG